MRVNKERLDAASSYFNSKLSFMDYLEKYKLLGTIITTNEGVAINCPFHIEKDPSFKIDLNRNYFKCFGCGVDGGGNLIRFIAKYETTVLGRKTSYSKVIENLLKSDRQYCVDLGFSTIYEELSTDLSAIKTLGIKKVKLKKSTPTTFLELSSYIKRYGTVDDMMKAMQLMQGGFSADLIHEMLFDIKKSDAFSDITLDDLFKED